MSVVGERTRRSRSFAYCWLLVAAAACAPGSDAAPNEFLSASEFRITLERTPAGLYADTFRPYRVELAPSGAFLFLCFGADGGEREQRGQVALDGLRTLWGGVRATRFFELEEEYLDDYNDGCWEILEVEAEGRRHRVRNYWMQMSLEFYRSLNVPMEPEQHAIHSALSALAQSVDEAVGTDEILARMIAAEDE